MLQECKYRLPCNWCDKYDRMCEAVLYEIYKENQEKNVGRPEPKEKKCDHQWSFWETRENTGGTYTYYRCNKCGSMMVRDSNGITYESGDWTP